MKHSRQAVDFLFIDGWLESLTSDRAKLGKVVSDIDVIEVDKSTMVIIDGTVEFAIDDRSGVIFGVNKDVIEKSCSYGLLRYWEQWRWIKPPERRIEPWGKELIT